MFLFTCSLKELGWVGAKLIVVIYFHKAPSHAHDGEGGSAKMADEWGMRSHVMCSTTSSKMCSSTHGSVWRTPWLSNPLSLVQFDMHMNISNVDITLHCRVEETKVWEMTWEVKFTEMVNCERRHWSSLKGQRQVLSWRSHIQEFTINKMKK